MLDGIGKGLDPRFDITEIAKPLVSYSYFIIFLYLLDIKSFKLYALHI